MPVTIVTAAERPDLRPAGDDLNAQAWPKFLDGSEATLRYWGGLYQDGLAQFQCYAVATDPGGTETVLATSNAVPFAWASPDDDATLPDDGWDAVLAMGVEGARAGIAANTLSAVAIVVSADARGSDLAERMILNMKTLTRRHGLSALVAPLRPTRKSAYPLQDFTHYVGWRTGAGQPFDPWVRKHCALGARIAKIAPRSMRVEATLEAWQAWTNLRFPDPGLYHLPGGLAPVHIDLERDTGLYLEPNLWVRHPL